MPNRPQGLAMNITGNNAVPHNDWKLFDYRGDRFYQFGVPVRDDREIPFTIAQRIAGRYDVQEMLTRGGGGVIFVAHDVRTRRTVLIKALADYDLQRVDLDEPFEEMVESVRRTRHHLQTERRLLVRLRNSGCNAVPHPNDYVFDANPVLEGPHRAQSGEVWRFDDTELLTTEPYLVMQHVPGMSLQELLDERYRRIDESTALRIIDHAARVVELLQQPIELSNGQTWQIVYQDMKPGNIIVDRQGRASVLDFGGCQVVIDGTLVLRGSHSPGYCAPECGVWDAPVTPAADTYALGTTLLHLLSGVNPRRLLPGNPAKTGRRAVRLDVRKMLGGKCSERTIEFLAQCVEWEPQDRHPNASEFRRALATLLTRAQ